jgi:hypothetical protein
VTYVLIVTFITSNFWSGVSITPFKTKKACETVAKSKELDRVGMSTVCLEVKE